MDRVAALRRPADGHGSVSEKPSRKDLPWLHSFGLSKTTADPAVLEVAVSLALVPLAAESCPAVTMLSQALLRKPSPLRVAC